MCLKQNVDVDVYEHQKDWVFSHSKSIDDVRCFYLNLSLSIHFPEELDEPKMTQSLSSQLNEDKLFFQNSKV